MRISRRSHRSPRASLISVRRIVRATPPAFARPPIVGWRETPARHHSTRMMGSTYDQGEHQADLSHRRGTCSPPGRAARQRRVTRTDIVEAALASLLSADHEERLEAALSKRIDKLARGLDRLEWNLDLSNEAFALFVRFWLTSTAPLPDTALPAAQATGRKGGRDLWSRSVAGWRPAQNSPTNYREMWATAFLAETRRPLCRHRTQHARPVIPSCHDFCQFDPCLTSTRLLGARLPKRK